MNGDRTNSMQYTETISHSNIHILLLSAEKLLASVWKITIVFRNLFIQITPIQVHMGERMNTPTDTQTRFYDCLLCLIGSKLPKYICKGTKAFIYKGILKYSSHRYQRNFIVCLEVISDWVNHLHRWWKQLY